jgi:hypothetical protein
VAYLIVSQLSHAPLNMTEQKQEICDLCHERPAFLLTCNGNTGESSSLCSTCYEQTASPEELESFRHIEQAVRNGKCQYCGGPASSGSMSWDGLKEEQADLCCESCMHDLTEFAERPENALPDHSDVKDKTKEEQVYRQIIERKRRQEEIKRQRIRERRQ